MAPRIARNAGRVAAVLTVATALVAACSSSTDPAPGDAAAPDATTSPTDAAKPDTAVADTGAPDTSRPDAVAADASDAATTDGDAPDAADAADAAPAPMVLTSLTLTNGGRFPATHTCNGANTSPALSWTAGPPGTQSYAVVMKDLTVPNQHWTLYDIPASTLAIPAGVPFGYMPGAPAPAGSKHGFVTFSTASFGYLGPCPPRPGDHDYVFTVYALAGATLAGAAMTDTPEVLETKIKAQKVNAGAEASLASKYKQP